MYCLSVAEVTASCSGLLSHHCRWCSVLPALLPAWAGSRVTTCQAALISTRAALQSTCLVGASHPHSKQDVQRATALHQSSPQTGHRDDDRPRQQKSTRCDVTRNVRAKSVAASYGTARAHGRSPPAASPLRPDARRARDRRSPGRLRWAMAHPPTDAPQPRTRRHAPNATKPRQGIDGSGRRRIRAGR